MHQQSGEGRVGIFGSRPSRPSAWPSRGLSREENGGRAFLGTENDACLAWLDEALRRLRAEGQTKMVGYLEAVSDEVLFETRGDPSVVDHGLPYLAEGAS